MKVRRKCKTKTWWRTDAQMTSKCGKNKEVRYGPQVSNVNDVLNTNTNANSLFLECFMQGSILPVTIPLPGHTPGDLQFFSYLAVYSPPPGTQKETIPDPRDSSSTTNTLFCVQNWFPYNSTTRRFDKSLNAFLEFTERRILHSIKKTWTLHWKRKLKKKSNRSGIPLASKEMFFTAQPVCYKF